MEINYGVEFSKKFIKKFRKLVKNNLVLEFKIQEIVNRMRINPFQSGLYTHKANIKGYGELYSTRVTGNIRIAWDFIDGTATILAVTVGGHEIYK